MYYQCEGGRGGVRRGRRAWLLQENVIRKPMKATKGLFTYKESQVKSSQDATFALCETFKRHILTPPFVETEMHAFIPCESSQVKSSQVKKLQ